MWMWIVCLDVDVCVDLCVNACINMCVFACIYTCVWALWNQHEHVRDWVHLKPLPAPFLVPSLFRGNERCLCFFIFHPYTCQAFSCALRRCWSVQVSPSRVFGTFLSVFPATNKLLQISITHISRLVNACRLIRRDCLCLTCPRTHSYTMHLFLDVGEYKVQKRFGGLRISILISIT